MRDESREYPVLPVCLMVAEEDCLVVGGGKIAARKVGLLLDACAEVTVVAPEIGEAMRALVESGRARHLARPFRDSDVLSCRLVFAVTDDPEVNSRIISVCRTCGVLCSAADENWPDGDLIMPATIRRHGLTVAVSTGGRSCRTAREVKERLAGMLDDMAAARAPDGQAVVPPATPTDSPENRERPRPRGPGHSIAEKESS